MRIEWRPDMDAHAYASAVADANNLRLSQLLGRTYPARTWHRLPDHLVRQLCLISGAPPEQIRQTSPYRRYPDFVVEHPIVGLLDPGTPSGQTLIDSLPAYDSRTYGIQFQTSRPSARLRSRLNLLVDLAQAVLRRITDVWPPGAMHDDHRRRPWVVSDPTRHHPCRQWSRRIKEYAALTLWEHTYLGDEVLPLHRTAAADFLLIDQLCSAAEELRSEEPSLAGAIQSFAEDLKTCPEPSQQWSPGPVHSEPIGPFNLPLLRAWPTALIELLNAVDEVCMALYLDEHLPSWMTSPVGEFWYAQTRTTSRRLERLIEHVAERPAAAALYDYVAAAATAQPPPMSWTQLWRHRAHLTTLTRQGPWPERPGMGNAFADLMWVDLCGHLPLHAARDVSRLRQAARLIEPTDTLTVRTQMLNLLNGDFDSTDLAFPACRNDLEATA